MKRFSVSYMMDKTEPGQAVIIAKTRTEAYLLFVLNYPENEENISALEGRGDLEARQSDELDFFETSVWSLKAALVEAYELGRRAAGAAGVHPLPETLRGELRMKGGAER